MTYLFILLNVLMVIWLQRSHVCSVMQVHDQCLSTMANRASAVQIKGSRLHAGMMCLCCHVCGLTPVWSKIRVRKGALRVWSHYLCLVSGCELLEHLLYHSFFNDTRKYYSTNNESAKKKKKITWTLNSSLRASQLWFICKTVGRQHLALKIMKINHSSWLQR